MDFGPQNHGKIKVVSPKQIGLITYNPPKKSDRPTNQPSNDFLLTTPTDFLRFFFRASIMHFTTAKENGFGIDREALQAVGPCPWRNGGFLVDQKSGFVHKI